MNILVIDDDKEWLGLVKEVIEEWVRDSSVICFEDPLEAINKFSVGWYDLAVVDCKMPKLDGYEVVRVLKRKDPGIRVVIYTGSIQMIDSRLADTVGADALLNKDPDGRALIEYIKKEFLFDSRPVNSSVG